MKLFTISIPYPRVIKGGNEQKKILVFLILLLQILFFSGLETASGQSTTGWLNPSSNPYNNGVQNPNYVYASDNQRAVFDNDNDVADFGGFNISLPANAIITGIEVQIEGANGGYGGGTPRQLEEVSLSWNGGTSFTPSVPLNTFTTTEGYRSIGNSLWERFWSITELSNANFRIRLDATLAYGTLSIDHVQVKINYATGQQLTYTGSNGQFTVPACVNSITVECWGGGGRGSTRTSDGAGAGGGGGSYAKRTITVTPGQNFNFYVGAGSSTTAAGQDTWFGNSSTLLAKGGYSAADNSNIAVGYQTGSVGSVIFNGGYGAMGESSYWNGYYGGGGGSSGGTASNGNYTTNNQTTQTGASVSGGGSGGNGGNDDSNGLPGVFPGGGGGGSHRENTTRTGGIGANGLIVVTYSSVVQSDSPSVSPVCSGATSVSGTSSESNGTIIELFKNGTTSIGTTTVTGGTWTKSGLAALTGGDVITAKATATGECTSDASSPVTVSTPSTAPTSISGTTTCTGSSTTLTANGGTLGTNGSYQWGTGSSIGSNIIGGATSASYTTPTLSANTTYWVRRVDTAPCNTVTGGVSQSVTVTSASTITLTSGTQNQTVCSGTSITTTVYTFGGSATNATVTNLPSGLSQNVNTGTKTVTISGTPTANGTYTITTSGHTAPCTAATIQGTITVNATSTITLTSGTQNQQVCSGTPITTTVYTFGGSATNATVTNLPSGLSQNVNTGTKTVTISGTPTASGTYTITTSGHTTPCTAATIQGTITLKAIPTVTITGNTSICVGSNTFLSPSSGGTWISNNPSVATVNNAGVVTGISTGNATFSFTDGITGCTGVTSAITVSPTPSVQGIAICQGGYGTLTSMSCGSGGTTSTSATFPGTGASITGVGSYSWSNPERITADDNSFARVDVGDEGITRYLRGTNFGFSIPLDATINGIEVSIGRYTESGSRGQNRDYIVKLVKGGTIVGVNKAKNTIPWPSTEGVATYGSSTDLWDVTWSPAEINASTFGVVLSALNTDSRDSRMAYVDYMRITVTYTTLPELTGWYTVPSGGVIVHSGSPFNPIGDAEVIAQGGIYANLVNSNTPGTYPFYAECTNMPGCRARADFVINPKPTTTIVPDPAEVCINQPLNLSVNVSGGGGTIITHNWWGTGGVFLNATDIPNPVFNSDYADTLNLSYNFIDINGCTGSDDIEIIVNPNNTVTDASSSPTPCIGTPMTPITHTTTGATGIGIPSGLPAGVTATWASNTITISGTPTTPGTFNYSIPLTGGCGTVNASGTINVRPENTVSAPSPAASTLCINTTLNPVITHTTTGATGIGTATGLPAGVTASWSSNTITISGTPTASGTFNYSIPLSGGCGNVYATGTIEVTPNNTAGAASSTPSICINTPLTNITHPTTGATGISNDNVSGANGLPAGISAHWAANTITISGTPTTAGTFNYAIPLTGGCGTVNATGTITVKAVDTVTPASLSPTVCVGTVMTSIIHTTTGATGIGTPSNLPTGVTAEWKLDRITINGTPSTTGTYNYTIPLTGGCGSVSATGTITVTPNMTVTGPSSILPVCVNAALTPITHTTTGATGIGSPTGLPAGVSATWAANTITISGTPTVSGTFSYSIPVTGGCGPTVFATGTITVDANMSATPPSGTPTLCINTALSPSITITTGGATGILNDNTSGANGLPAGVSAHWATNTISISGTPTVSGTFNYSIPLAGGCGSGNATGTITVTPDNTVTIPSAPTTVCINTSLPVISLTTTGATGIGTPTGLPAGVTAVWAANTITITGTPTVSGAFDYSIPLTGGCGAVNATGTINVTEASTANAGTAMADICQGQTSAALGGSVGGSATGGSWSSSAGGTFNPSASDLNATWTPPAGYSGTATLVLATTGPCASASASKTIIVNPLKPVSLTISADTNPVCAGSSVTFTATPVNGGANPTYQWRVNSINTGTNSPSFTFTPTNGDVVTCVLTSNATCASGSPATSPPVSMIVNPLLPASVSIATSANPVCDGTSVTFTATPTNGGTNPTYQWYKNSTAVATGSTYSYTPANGDQVYVVMTADPTLTCGTGSPATSTTVTMVVNPLLPAGVSIAASANPVCDGTSVTFTATPTNGGTNPTYQWYKNSTAVATGSTYSYAPAHGDQIYVVMTADPTLTCGTGSPATSNTIPMVVNPLLPAGVSIAASANPVCDGTSVTFTATPTNGGTTPTYQWYKNTVAVATGSTYSYAPAHGDQIYVVMTADPTLTCGTGSPATSETVTMTVNPLLPAGVSIAASANPVCDGTSVTFTATPTNGGTTPTYQWYKNSVAVATGPTYSYAPAHGDQVYVVMTADPTLTCGTGSPATSGTITMGVNSILHAGVSIAASANPVCDGTSVTFTATPTNGGTTPTYQWYKNSVALATGPTYSYVPAHGDQVYVVMAADPTLSCSMGSPATSNTIPMVVNPLLPVSVSIAASANPVCDGTSVTFTATPTNGGTAPAYQWYKNSVAVATGPTYSYTPAHGDQVYVVMTADPTLTCGTGSPATSNTIPMVVNPLLPVSVSISASANPVCDGTSVTFSATPTNGGTTPTYQWFKNSTAVATGSTYSYTPANGDLVYVVMTADPSLNCGTGSPATSNTIPMVVNSTLPASVSIAASANPVCDGTSVTFTATPINGGTTPTYQWYKNSVAIATGPTYSYTPAHGDQVYVVMTADPNLNCGTGSPATSNTVTMVVNPLLPVSVSISASANPVCNGSSVTFTATPTNGGTNPTYQWYKNSVAVATGSTYSNTPANGDQVYVVMTADPTLICGTGSPATSSTVTMVVNPLLPVSVSIAASSNPVCDGTSVTFTATPTNGGTTPTYQWYKNSVAVATGPTYSYTPAHGDQVYVVMTADPTLNCGTGSPATSNTIPMVVNPLLPVSVSIAASANSVCDGTSVTFTATPTNGGTTPTYQWYKNSTAVATGSTYSYTPAHGDQVYVVMTADPTLNCGTGSPATSNTIPMVVNPLLPVSVSISASANPVCNGSSVTFTATPTNGGSNPVYQWRVNSTPTGSNLPTYSYNPTNGDVVTCVLTSNANCISGNPSTSNQVTMTVNPLPTATIEGTASVCLNDPQPLVKFSGSGGTSPYTFTYRVNSGAFLTVTTAVNQSAVTLPVPTATPGSNIYELVSVSDQYSCSNPVSNSVTVTINPKPFMNPVSNQVKCDGENSNAISFSGTNVTTYHWTNNNPSIGIPASGTGDISSSLLDNSGGTPVVATFTVTPRYSAGGVDCDGTPVTFTITVNPSLTPPTAITVSAGAEPPCQLTNSTTTTTYATNASNYTDLTWSVSPGGAGVINSSGMITWTNGFAGNVDISVVATGCNGSSSQVTRTINITPTVSTPSPITITAGTEPTCQLTNGTTTTTYSTMANNNTGFNWSVIPTEAGTINSSGVMTWANGFSGIATIMVTASGCNGPSAPVTRVVTVYTLPTVAISYPASTYCTSETTPIPVTISGTGAITGGSYSSSPAGLTINSIGTINPSGSAPGTYIVTYTLPTAGCGTITANTTVTITALPTVTFNYAGNPFCNSVTTEQPVTVTGTGAYSGGTYSSTLAGLSLNPTTGGITPSTSTPGTYTVSYSTLAAGGCGVVTATRSVTVTTMPVATFSYPSNTYCTNAPNPSPVFSGGVAGTFTASPSGLEFVSPTTGQIDMINSKTGNYTVTNTVAASGGCPQVSATFNVVIVVQPTAAISYSGSPFCTSLTASQPVTLTGTGVFTGGTFSSSPAGLSIDSSTGAITPSASTAGTYTVTYNLAVAGGCNPVTATTQVTITLAPVATFSYPGSPFCSNAGLVSPTFSGGGVPGTFSAPPGLVLNSATGEIDVSASITGTYIITNTIPAANGCATVTATTSVTIHVRPAITVDYCSAESPKIRIQASGGTSYSWVTSPYQGVTADHIDVDLVGVYGVTVTNGTCVQTIYNTVNDEKVTNGSFTNGNDGSFTSGYTYKQDLPGLVPANYGELYDDSGTNGYSITTNGQNVHINFWGTDHTNNPIGARNFMAVNGHGTIIIWTESNIMVEAGKTYYFSAYARSLNDAGHYANLSFSINGSQSGMNVTSTGILPYYDHNNSNTWGWTRFYGNWTAPSSGPITLSIIDLVNDLSGNDFAIDDISFGTLEPPPSTLISATGTDNQTICVDTRLTDIRYSTYKAATATVTGLPAGVTASTIISNVLTISGIPTEFGVFNYTITFSGCGPDFTKTGKITVRPPVTAGIISGTSPLCIATTATYSSDGTTGGTWSSSNPSIATVNASTGLVTPLSPGTTNITYTVNSGCGAPLYSFKTLTVMPNASIASVTGTNASLCIGGTITYSADGVVLSGGTGTWSSSNTSVATVDANGNITGVGPGTCDITYTISGGCSGIVSKSKPVTVVTAGTITGTSPLCTGDKTTFTDSGTPGGTWSSSNPAVAVVNATTGEITAVSPGTVDISYTLSSSCGPVTATKTVTVNPDGNPGTITGNNQVCIGVGTTFTISGTPGGTWSSTNTSVATVNPVTGVVTGVDPGQCNIVYTLPSGIFCGANLTTMMPISVFPDANITSVTGTKDQLCTGESTTLMANDVVLGGGTGAWSSSNINIVTVDAAGLVTAIGEGTATVSYTITGGCGGTKSKEKQITVIICKLHYRTVTDGLWNNHSIWETSENLGGPWTSATTSPTAYNSLSITVRNTHTVEVTTNVPVARTTIEPGGEVTINAGATVNNVGTNGAADFVINSESATTGNGYGSLQVSGFYSGLITYNLWVTNSGCPGYTDRAYIISSPVSGQEAQALRNAGSITGIKDYNEEINDWGGDISGNLAPGKGYAIYKAGSPGLVPFIGTPNTGDIQVPVSSSYSRYGWNSVGNPYTSALQIKENTGFIYHNMVTNPVLEPGYGAIYMWNEGICNFDVINLSGYFNSDWTNNYYGFVNYSTDPVVQVGQGFLVNILWPHPGRDIQFTPRMQLHSAKTSLKKASTSWPGITLVAQNGTTTERTIITFFEGGTTGMDPGYDAGTLPAYPFQLYSRMVNGNENFNLAIQTLPVDQYEQLVVPIGIESPSGGEVTFKAGGVILPEGLYPIFEDRLLNTNTPLKTFNDSYKVAIPPGTRGTGRFYIRFSHVTPVNSVLQPAFMLAAWFADNRIVISGNTGNNARATLYDLNGRKLGDYLLTGENRNEIPAKDVVTGIYLLHIRGNSGTQVIKVPVVMNK